MPRYLRPDRVFVPWMAAALLGAVLALSLLWTQRGLHVSGVFALGCPAPAATNASAAAGSCPAPGAADANWIAWMVAGIAAGAFLAALWRVRGFHWAIERGRGVGRGMRLVHAAAGGLVAGAGAAIAVGCTSSIGLTGGALLSLAAFAFLGAFFAGGFAARTFLGRYWQ